MQGCAWSLASDVEMARCSIRLDLWEAVCVPTWNVELRGRITNEVQAAICRDGIVPGGLSHSRRGSESRSVRVDAPTAHEAVKRAEAATIGFPVSVRKALGPV